MRELQIRTMLEQEEETYWELLRRRYQKVEADGRLNWYLRMNEAGNLALSLPPFPEVDLFELAQEFGSMQLNILPILRATVQERRQLLEQITRQVGYPGRSLGNAYASKVNDDPLVTQNVITLGEHYEISSPAGVAAAIWMRQRGILPEGRLVICNGYFNQAYADAIRKMRTQGYETIIPVLDKRDLLRYFTNDPTQSYQIGLRRKARIGISSSQEADQVTSPFGMRWKEILKVAEEIEAAPNTKLVLYHMHLGSQIEDEEGLLAGLRVGIEEYCQLKRRHPSLHIFDIGGGVPVSYSFKESSFNLERFWRNFLLMVKSVCQRYQVPEPDLLSEWGRHTVADYEIRIWRIIDNYNHTYQLDGTIMGSLPDHWGIGQTFLVLAVNGFKRTWNFYRIRGLTCDEDDEYRERIARSTKVWQQMLFDLAHWFGLSSGEGLIPLPVMAPPQEDFYVAFCATGAYQDNLGQLRHCLQPEDREFTADFINGRWEFRETKPEETPQDLLREVGWILD